MTQTGPSSHRRRRVLALAGGGTLVLILEGLSLPAAQAASSAIVTGKALGAVNAYRRANGRDALKSDAALGRAARDHSVAMAKSGRLNHRQFRSRLRKFKISGAAAENVASGQADVAAVLAAWQNSRGHRRNLLGRYSRVGVAVARNPSSGNRPFWTMILAA